jgi:tetratricopeptide (TPR) repeat protein
MFSKTGKIWLFLFMPLVIYAQETKQVLQKADSLIAAHQYKTAYNLLADADPDNYDPDITLKKIELLRNYFVVCMNDLAYSLEDLKENQTLNEMRHSKNLVTTLIGFRVDSTLKKLIKRFPEDGRLYETLGDFYISLLHKYGGNWIESTEKIKNQARESLEKAVELGVNKPLIYNYLGEIYMLDENFRKALKYYEKTLKSDTANATAYYNSAYAYLQLNEWDKAIDNALKSTRFYKDSVMIADAYRLGGAAAMQKKSFDRALQLFELSNRFKPGVYETYLWLVESAIMAQNKQKEKEYFEKTIALDPGNPTVYDDLGQIYFSRNKIKDYLDHLSALTGKYKGRDKVEASLYFFMAKSQLVTGEKKKALKNFMKAREKFEKVLPADHQVFSVIDSIVKELKKTE